MTSSVGDYARISYGDEAGGGLGIARQQTDNRALIALRRWSHARSYVDQDISAYQPDTVRPQFEQMLSDLETGLLSGIVAYDLDRLFRQPSDLERAIRIYDRKPGLVFATVQGDIDLSTSDGRTLARVMVAFANKASMDTARRVSRKKLERAMNGMSTSNYRAFGWNEDGTLHPQEAAILRKAIDDVIQGIGLFVICDRLNEAGTRTVRGHTWKTSAMRRILTAPRIAGYAVYQGEVLQGEDGQLVRGQWEPLVDEDTWRALDGILRPRKGTYPNRRKHYLLSGIARCGRCGMGMVGLTRDGKVRYNCRSKDSGGCAGTSITGDDLDKLIANMVYLLQNEIQTASQTENTFPELNRLTQIGEQIAELMKEYQQGLSGAVVFPTIRSLEEEQRVLQSEQARFIRTRKTQAPPMYQWRTADLDERRAIIKYYIDAIMIKPTGRTGAGFDPKRVDVIWVPGLAEQLREMNLDMLSPEAVAMWLPYAQDLDGPTD